MFGLRGDDTGLGSLSFALSPPTHQSREAEARGVERQSSGKWRRRNWCRGSRVRAAVGTAAARPTTREFEGGINC